MSNERLCCIFILLLGVFLCRCTRGGGNPALARLDKEANACMSGYDNTGLDSVAGLLLDESRRAGDRAYEGKAHFYLSFLTAERDDSADMAKMRHLDEAEAIARETGNDTLLAMVYNQRGVWEFGAFRSPVTARYWLNRSMETARPLGQRWISLPAEINMSESCRLVGDTVGIRYDRDLFDYASRAGDSLLLFSTGLHCAVYYADKVSDTAMLRPYIDAVRMMSDRIAGVDCMIYARFFLSQGDYDAAERFILMADPMSHTDYQVLYAEILSRQERYADSERVLDSVASDASWLYPGDNLKVLRLRASNAEGLGDWELACRRRKDYEAFRDSLDRANTRDLQKKYQIEYEVNVKDREIDVQNLKIRNMKAVILAAALMIVMIVAGYMFYHVKRNRLYRDIVRQNLDCLARQKDYEKRLAVCNSRIAGLEKAGSAVTPERMKKMSEEKIDSVFEKIRELAEVRQVWRDVTITRETFADMVGCNRTYFTEAIRERTGMSYTQYMNSCRTNEAIRILSDTDDSTPLKILAAQLGFLSLATFYSSFKQATGISPAAYRKTVCTLKKSAARNSVNDG